MHQALQASHRGHVTSLRSHLKNPRPLEIERLNPFVPNIYDSVQPQKQSHFCDEKTRLNQFR